MNSNTITRESLITSEKAERHFKNLKDRGYQVFLCPGVLVFNEKINEPKDKVHNISCYVWIKNAGGCCDNCSQMNYDEQRKIEMSRTKDAATSAKPAVKKMKINPYVGFIHSYPDPFTKVTLKEEEA